jgi:hypothetical protein
MQERANVNLLGTDKLRLGSSISEVDLSSNFRHVELNLDTLWAHAMLVSE